MAKERKGKYRWDPAKAKRWGETQRARNRAKNPKVGDVDPAAAAGGPPDTGGPLPGGPGDGGSPDHGGPSRGTFDGAKPADPSKEEKPPTAGPSTVTDEDLKTVWETLPDLFKLFILGLNNWMPLISDNPRVKVVVWFDPLKDSEAKTLAAFSRPWIKAHLPHWIEQNPGLAFLCVPLFILIFKFRFKMKVYKGGQWFNPDPEYLGKAA